MSNAYRWIETASELEAFCSAIADGTVIAVDTESDHFFAYRPYVALIQVATVDEAVLVDPLALSAEELDPLLALVEDPKIITIMHSARNDIAELDRDWGIEAANIFDTQLAARFLGYEKFSLDALLQKTAGIKLNKKYQRFNWARRPIPEPARAYAIEDVVYLFDLRDRLLRELQAEGWMRAFVEQGAQLVASSGYEESEFDPEKWRKLKGSKELDDLGRGVCAALYRYRHDLCEKLDRAPLHVLENGALIKLARQRPRTLAELGAVRGIGKKTLERNSTEILEVIETALSAKPPPAKRPRGNGTGTGGKRPSAAERRLVKELLTARQELAAEVGLALDFVISRSALEELAALMPTETSQLDQVSGLLQWQREYFGAQLVEVCVSKG